MKVPFNFLIREFSSPLFARGGKPSSIGNQYMQTSRKKSVSVFKNSICLSRSHFIIKRLLRAQGHTIVCASSTTSAGRRFISQRGLLHGLVVSAHFATESKEPVSNWRKRLYGLSLRLRIIDGARVPRFIQSLSIRRGTTRRRYFLPCLALR